MYPTDTVWSVVVSMVQLSTDALCAHAEKMQTPGSLARDYGHPIWFNFRHDGAGKDRAVASELRKHLALFHVPHTHSEALGRCQGKTAVRRDGDSLPSTKGVL